MDVTKIPLLENSSYSKSKKQKLVDVDRDLGWILRPLSYIESE